MATRLIIIQWEIKFIWSYMYGNIRYEHHVTTDSNKESVECSRGRIEQGQVLSFAGQKKSGNLCGSWKRFIFHLGLIANTMYREVLNDWLFNTVLLILSDVINTTLCVTDLLCVTHIWVDKLTTTGSDNGILVHCDWWCHMSTHLDRHWLR